MLELVILSVGAGLSLAAASMAVARGAGAVWARGWRPEAVLVAAIAAVLAFLVTRGAVAGAFPASDLRESLALVSVGIGLCHLAFARSAENRNVGAFVLPVAAAFAVGSAAAAWTPVSPPRTFDALLLGLHATSSLAAYALFAFSSAAGVAYLVQERAIRRRTLGGICARLPSLAALDALSFRAVALAFPLLSLGMVTGSVWALRAWGSYWLWEPKLTLALLLWLLAAAIFHLRAIERYQGRRTAVLAIASALMVLAAFLGPILLPGGRHDFL